MCIDKCIQRGREGREPGEDDDGEVDVLDSEAEEGARVVEVG
jgi:hypothetical protein